MWDTGAVPDSAWTPTGSPMTEHLVLFDGQTRDVTMRKSLRSQLAEIGYAPSAITYLALSHYQPTTLRELNDFGNATWPCVSPSAT